MATDFTSPTPELAVGTRHAGFVVIRAEAVPEVSGCAYVMRHQSTGARAMWLACADDNKAFSIAFKTPPANDTGVFHILEHSVLCGSDRYPVKEPFVHLLKTSMQTFLNALTFSDKTMYPVSSTNEQDLENLMDVYLDAVLHPAIYRRPRIFEQEGWHYELESADAPLTYNGVVYNEMKGALSNPDEILVAGISRALYPDTAYGFISGGDPKAIPDLTYDEFLDNHARHYRLDNSYSILYGNLDIERELAFLDERFSAAPERHADAPNPLEAQPALHAPYLRVPMDTTPDNACVGIGYVFAEATQRERVLAADILMDALMGSNEAPLKRAVLDSGLGRDVSGFLFDGMLQPCLVFQLKGAKPDVAEQFRALVEGTCARLVREGLGHDNLEASLAQAEFNLREGDFGYPDGVGLAITAMNGWLYDDDAALDYLRYEDELARMRTGLGDGYFERLLDEAVCRCPHTCLVEVVPEPSEGTSAETTRLAEVRSRLTPEQLEGIVEESAALHEEQATPDTPEAVATLPRLTVADISEPAEDAPVRPVEAPVPCFHHDLETHHIDYGYLYFGLDCVRFEELPYVTVLCNLLGKLDTERRSAYELDTICEAKLGNLSFFTETYSDDLDTSVSRPKLVVGASSLSENVRWLAELPAEIWSQTCFDDTDRIRDILRQRRLGMEMSFVDSGHAAAMSRVSSYFSASSLTAEKLGGVDFYRFLCDLLEHFDERADELKGRLRDLCARIFRSGNCEVSLAGAAEDVTAFWQAAGSLGLGEGSAPKLLEVPEPSVRNEAFVVPAGVCFVGEGSVAATPQSVEDLACWRVASQVLSLDYLWNEVRVLGGAYGCGFRCTADSLLQFYSFRDPAVDPTVRRFEDAARWLREWQPSQEDLDGFVVATVASMDAPMKPRVRARRADAQRLSGRPQDWRARLRARTLSVTLDDVHACGEKLARLSEDRGLCVFGGREILAANTEGLDLIELVGGER